MKKISSPLLWFIIIYLASIGVYAVAVLLIHIFVFLLK